MAYLATKPKDKTLDAYIASGGYQRTQDWPPKRGAVFKRAASAEEMPRRLVWPDATGLDPSHPEARVHQGP